MKQTSLDISLLQPLVISQQSASAGAHHSLDYIPGSTLLGVAAGHLYGQLDSNDAFTLFHSGRVRFGDALPLLGDDIALPVPLSWHVFKGESATTDFGNKGSAEYFDSNKIFDAGQSESVNRQPEQQRSGYVGPDGRQVRPVMEQTLKTAIDAATGTAATSQLFGYEALSAGQQYRCTLQADDDVDGNLWQQLLETLQGKARIGRSRSAQFGQVRITRAETAHAASRSGPMTDDQLTLWLTSDLLLHDRGQPCLIPQPKLLGLPEGSTWQAGKSFIRSRRYSSYNGYRRHYDPERQVISRGSVLRYQLPTGCDPELAERLAQGLGRRQEVGLGQAMVNPALLAQARPRFAEHRRSSAKHDSGSKDIPSPNTPLIRLLTLRAKEIEQGRSIAGVTEWIYTGLCAEVGKARSYHGLLDATPLPSVPERSQWGRLRQLASNHRQHSQALWEALTHDDNGMLRARSGWELRTGPGPKATLGQWLQHALKAYQQSADLPDIVGQLANYGCSEHWARCCLGSGKVQTREASV